MFLHLWKLNKGLNLRFFKGNINSGQALFRCAVVSSWLPQLRQLLLLGYFSLLFFLRWIKTAMTSFQFLYNYQWYPFVINNTACVVRPTTANSSLKCYLNWGLIWTLTFAGSHRSINFAPNDDVLFFLNWCSLTVTLHRRCFFVACLIYYGLMTFYQDNLEDVLQKCSVSMLAFNEANNQIAQKGQIVFVSCFIFF